MEVARAFHQFYFQCQILDDDPLVARARLQLSLLTRRVLHRVLDLIGVEAPEAMGDKPTDS